MIILKTNVLKILARYIITVKKEIEKETEKIKKTVQLLFLSTN